MPPAAEAKRLEGIVWKLKQYGSLRLRDLHSHLSVCLGVWECAGTSI